MDTAFTKITDMLVNRFGVPAEEIEPDVAFTDLDLDSLTLVEFALVAEQEFGVTISDAEISLNDTVVTVAALIDSKKAPA